MKYGLVPHYQPPKTPSLAQAAATAGNPFGLGSGTGLVAPAPATPPIKPPAAPNPSQQSGVSAGRAFATAQPTGSPTADRPAAATFNSYDLNTDPALQQIQALAGLSDQQAQAQALKERQNLLLQYGDPDVAAAVLGANDPTVTASKANPTSTVSQLGQSRDRNLKSLDDQLNSANLSYSGYRVAQEQQAGQDYQNALAQAAAALNTNLDTVAGNLTSALAADQAQRAQGIQDAADRASQQAATLGIDPGAPSLATVAGTPTVAAGKPPDIIKALAGLFAPAPKKPVSRTGGLSANARQGVYAIH